ncbi:MULTISPECIES: hypothetical protein [unclassified Streptomyces]|uniref:hypothetical protein n=1 Tax=unclassified Streptomyces TaxID=2593676 RepID=UPI0037F3D7DD
MSAAQAGTTAETVAVVFAARFMALGSVVLFSGALLDRINPVAGAVAADSARVAMFICTAVFWDGSLHVLIFAAALVIGVCEAISEPALLVIVPRVLRYGRALLRDAAADPVWGEPLPLRAPDGAALVRSLEASLHRVLERRGEPGGPDACR